MKKILGMIISLILTVTIISCEDNTFDLDYTTPLQINFEGVGENNIVKVDKGVLSYDVKIKVSAPEVGIKFFEVYNANSLTGEREDLIEGTSQILEDEEGNGIPSYEIIYSIDNLTENKCFKVVATDGGGNFYEKNLFVEITPTVIFTSPLKIETVEDYYGPYFATWLNGRVYMRQDGKDYINEIDISLGNVVIESIGPDTIPALINPALRNSYNLLTIEGLQQTKFALTDLTQSDFNAITQVDESTITSLADPTEDAVTLSAGSVYSFKTASGKKGLIYVSELASKSGTIENVSGEWIPNTPYHQATILSKSIKE